MTIIILAAVVAIASAAATVTVIVVMNARARERRHLEEMRKKNLPEFEPYRRDDLTPPPA